jgi:hypothetical protein
MLWAVGCGGDEGANDKDMASGGQDMSVEADMGGEGDMTPGEFNPPAMYATRYMLRFDSLTFVPPTPPTLVGLNNILRQNFDQDLNFPVIILVEIRDISTQAGTVKLRGGAGLKGASAGNYRWDPEGDDMFFDGTLDVATGRVLGTIQNFKFVATFESEDPNMPLRSSIPINDLQFDGYLEEDAADPMRAQIKVGRLDGNITKEQAETTMITITPAGGPIPLSSLLPANGLNLDLNGDGVNDAWRVRATFTAVPTRIML